MKRLLNLFYATILCVTLAIPSTLIVGGCQSASQQRKTHNAIWTLAAGVDASYRAYVDSVILGQVPTNRVPVVAQAYGNFQLTLRLALLAVDRNTNAPPPPELVTAATKFNFLVNSVKKGNP